MAYLTAGEFRQGAVSWYTKGLELSDEEAPTTLITAAIASKSAEFDRWCDDHFEAENALAVTIDVQHGTGNRLYLPKRIRSVTSVETIDRNGTATVETSTKYRVHSSLNAAGSDLSGQLDWLEIIYGETLSTGYGWLCGSGTVRVTGNWSWATCPDRAKRAVAIMVWDSFKPRGDSQLRAERWQTDGAAYDRSLTEPSGLPEVDGIVAQLRRSPM